MEEAWVDEAAAEDLTEDEAGSLPAEPELEPENAAAGPGAVKLLKLSSQISGHWTLL